MIMTLRVYRAFAYISLYLSLLCLLAVITFHFPKYLSNPMLRASYDVDQLRLLLFVSLLTAFALGVIALLFSEVKKRSLLALCLASIASFLGGSTVKVPESLNQGFYLSLDLVILDLFFMSLIFIPLEKLWPQRRQRTLREGLKTDLAHYGLNHLLMGGVFFLIAMPGNWLRDRYGMPEIQEWVRNLPLFVQVVLILFIADFFQYWTHRSFHKIPRLWQFHKIHHSTQHMDWIASSRLHVVDVIMTRAISYVPIVMLGFSDQAVHIYLPVVALQALLVHSNVRFRFGMLKYFFTVPLVHHWHHSSEEPALDKNFAVSFSIIDVVFRTYYCPKNWPERYGLHGEQISEIFYQQLVYPFLKSLNFKKKSTF